jgi:hypothetical protein
MRELHGDQNWITQCLWPNGISLLPLGLACSYKYRQLRNEPVAPIVVFHGEPKPHQVRDKWVRECWQ